MVPMQNDIGTRTHFVARLNLAQTAGGMLPVSARPNYKFFVIGDDAKLNVLLEALFGDKFKHIEADVIYLPTEGDIAVHCDDPVAVECKTDDGKVTRKGYYLSDVREFALSDTSKNRLIWRRTSDGWGNFSLYPVDTSGQIGTLGDALNAVVAPGRISSYVQLGTRERVET